jgi:hypothetical protein
MLLPKSLLHFAYIFASVQVEASSVPWAQILGCTGAIEIEMKLKFMLTTLLLLFQWGYYQVFLLVLSLSLLLTWFLSLLLLLKGVTET